MLSPDGRPEGLTIAVFPVIWRNRLQELASEWSFLNLPGRPSTAGRRCTFYLLLTVFPQWHSLLSFTLVPLRKDLTLVKRKCAPALARAVSPKDMVAAVKKGQKEAKDINIERSSSQRFLCVGCMLMSCVCYLLTHRCYVFRKNGMGAGTEVFYGLSFVKTTSVQRPWAHVYLLRTDGLLLTTHLLLSPCGVWERRP